MTVEFRNARLIRDDAIECEIKHSRLGWIPFGAVADEPGLPGEVFAAALPQATDERDPEADLAAERAIMVASRFQARMALRNADLFEAANNAVYESKDAFLIEAWESAVEFRRLSPSILKLGAALGLNNAAIDQLFRDAAAITA